MALGHKMAIYASRSFLQFYQTMEIYLIWKGTIWVYIILAYSSMTSRVAIDDVSM